MSITRITPYLNFHGTAAEAIRHDEREVLSRRSDVPGRSVPAEHEDVMHARPRLGGGRVARLGMVTDAYGVRRMFNCSK